MRRITFALLLLVGLAACSSPPSGETIEVAVMDFMLEPPTLEVTGPAVTIVVTNDGPTPHNFSVRDAGGTVVLATDELGRDASQTITGELEPRTYTTFCNLPGHESLGMRGSLTVTAP